MTDNLSVAVGETAAWLQKNVLSGRGDRKEARARATLAQLRRNVGRPPESDPLGLSRVLMALHPALDADLVGRGDAATASERAAYHALTFFSLHMQSAKEPMHVPEKSFAAACGQMYRGNASGSFKPRFDAMVLSRNEYSRLHHMRSLITMLRGARIGFDYGRLAFDLRSLENPARRKKTLMRWGRDFAWIPTDSEETPENQ